MIISEQRKNKGKGDRDMKKILCVIVSAVFAISLSSCAFFDYFKETSNDVYQSNDETVVDNYITVGVYDADTYNPILTQSSVVSNILGFVFEPMFSVNEDSTISTVLAESFTTTPDGKSITVNIKQGVKWHDGSEFVSPDVVYTVNKIKESNSKYSAYVKNVSKVTVIDYYTLKITFSRSVPAPETLLSFPIIKEYSADVSKFIPIGTGPFKFDDDNLISFDLYHGKPAEIDKVNIKTVPDKDKYISLFNAGVLDIADSSIVDMNSYTPKSNAQVYNFVSNDMVFVGFNCKSRVFKYSSARRSVSKLVDRKNIVSHIYLSGAEAVVYPINPDSYVYPETEINLYKDLSTAEEELATNGWKLNANDIYFISETSGTTYFTVEILVNGDNEKRVKIAEELSKTMNNMGMFNNVTKCSSDEFSNRINSGNYDMFIGETELAPNGDLSDLLLMEDNIFNYSNESCNAILTQIGTLTTTENIKAVWSNLADIIVEDAPVASICFIKDSFITGARIKTGIEPSITATVRKTENWSLQ